MSGIVPDREPEAIQKVDPNSQEPTGNEPTEQEPTDNPADTVTPQEPQETPQEPEEPQGDTDPNAPKEDPVEPQGESESINVQFEGIDVPVDVPADVVAQLSDVGLKADEVVKELYDGEFGLGEETKAKLYEKYGQGLVDTYLGAIKSHNELVVKQMGEATAAQEQANEARWNETLEQVGGEDNWNTMETWAADNLTDAQFDEFNSVMEGGNAYAQKLAVQDLMAQYRNAEGDHSLNLVNGDTTKPSGDDSALSREQYLAVIGTQEYKDNPAKFDAMRRKGMQKGI